ncbi:hypothetical protein [Winogradskyella marincola]|uniref:Uncharacterized protein n=1 Tax=Winogradskyella marincola TaxID=3037795 RepID=A0ABT6G3F7_9FLAO|nr:hypothetical protein [Winogradskyella sp. YYF002]MDG4716591.1 hypothetical protein [Winogradskyella sp. YYF002]
MKLFFPLNRNTLALIFVAITALGLFTSGMFEVLDYFIIKTLLLGFLGGMFVLAFWYALKNDTKKNHPEDKLQDDSN